MGKTHAVDGTPLDPTAVAYPCGLVAQTLFNDTFAIAKSYPFASGAHQVHINDTNIALKSDLTYKFKNLEDNWQSVQWIDMTDCKPILMMQNTS